MVDIAHIQQDALGIGDMLAPADLPQARNARFDGEPFLCPLPIARQFAGVDHARPYERHLPDQNVEQFGMPGKIFVGIGDHSAKLQRIEATTLVSNDLPEMEDLAPIIELDADSDSQEIRHEHKNTDSG